MAPWLVVITTRDLAAAARAAAGATKSSPAPHKKLRRPSLMPCTSSAALHPGLAPSVAIGRPAASVPPSKSARAREGAVLHAREASISGFRCFGTSTRG